MAPLRPSLASLVVALGACSYEPPPTAETQSALGPPGACDNEHWVGVAPGGSCPGLGMWSASSLPPLGSSGAILCAYTWTGLGDPLPSDVAALTGAPFLVDLARDCPVVAPMEVISDASGPDRVQAHRRRLSLPLPASARAARLAILDTLPFGAASPRALHGPLMVGFAAEIACPSVGCGLEILPELALPLDDSGEVDLVRGGFYGRPSHLARAIDAAVDRWRTDPRAAQAPLVLSMSLGWAPEGELADKVPVDHMVDFSLFRPGVAGPVRAVHAALARARCSGALLVAAGGNDPTLRNAPGPLLPAAWARLAAPSATECACALASGKRGCGGKVRKEGAPDRERREPLIHAVGGVDLEDAPSRVGRKEGHGPMVVPSEQASLRWDNGYVVRSGTSIAAARLAATAAAVWSYRPSLPPGEVIDAIWRAGERLGRASLVCPGTAPCPEVRRLAPCRALQEVGVTVSCPSVAPAFSAVEASALTARLSTGGVRGSVASVAATVPSGGLSFLVSSSTCTHPLSSRAPNPPWPCPVDLLPPAQTWPAIAPQPEDPMCPDCMYSITSQELLLSLDGGVAAPSAAVLYLQGPAQTKAYDLLALTSPQGGLFPGQAFIIEGLSAPLAVSKAWLEVAVQDGGMTTVRADLVTLLP